MGYLIDTNVIANFTSVKFSEKAMDFLAEVIDETPHYLRAMQTSIVFQI